MHGRRSLHPNHEELNPEIKRNARSHPSTSKHTTPMADDLENNQQNRGLFGDQNNQQGRDQGRDQHDIKDYFIPGKFMTHGGFGQPPLLATHYEIKPGLLNLLPNFYGRENDYPYSHLTKFLDLSSTVHFMHFNDDALRLNVISVLK